MTTPAFSVGERRPLVSAAQYYPGTNARHYDVTPDDQRFVFVRPVGITGGELIVVENFFEELKAKVGN